MICTKSFRERIAWSFAGKERALTASDSNGDGIPAAPGTEEHPGSDG